MDGRGLDERRLRLLLEIGTSIVAELDSEAVLQRVLEAGRELTGARYAAIGILDSERRGLERFLTAGVDEETRRAIGELPRGSGDPRRADPQPQAAAAGRHQPAPAQLRVPARAPADDDLPGRAGARPRRGVGKHLPDREGRRRVRRGRRAGPAGAREVGGHSDRERPPLRGHRRPPRRARACRERARGNGRHCARGGRRDGPRPGGGARRQAWPCAGRRARAAGAARGRRPAGGGGSCRRAR